MKYWKPIALSIAIQSGLLLLFAGILGSMKAPLAAAASVYIFGAVITGSTFLYFLVWLISRFLLSETTSRFVWTGFIAYVIGWVLILATAYLYRAGPGYFDRRQQEQEEQAFLKTMTERFLDRMQLTTEGYNAGDHSFTLTRGAQSFSVKFWDPYLLVRESHISDMDSVQLLDKLMYYAFLFCSDSVSRLVDRAKEHNKIYLNHNNSPSLHISLPSADPLIWGGWEYEQALLYIYIKEDYLKEPIR